MFSSLQTEVVKLERITRTNVNGEAVASTAVISRGVPCHIQEKHGEIRLSAGGESLAYDATGWFDFGLDIRPNGKSGGDIDRVVVSESPRIPAGTIYIVLHAIPSPGVAHHVEVKLRRVGSSSGP